MIINAEVQAKKGAAGKGKGEPEAIDKELKEAMAEAEEEAKKKKKAKQNGLKLSRVRRSERKLSDRKFTKHAKASTSSADVTPIKVSSEVILKHTVVKTENQDGTKSTKKVSIWLFGSRDAAGADKSKDAGRAVPLGSKEIEGDIDKIKESLAALRKEFEDVNGALEKLLKTDGKDEKAKEDQREKLKDCWCKAILKAFGKDKDDYKDPEDKKDSKTKTSERSSCMKSKSTDKRGGIFGKDMDVHALVQWVIRESYQESNQDLYYYAKKVRDLNEKKKSIRERLAGMRTSAASAKADGKEKEMEAVKNLEEKLNTLGDDSQLANIDLQSMLQKQQQNLQKLSNISKMLHDTAQAIIRKIGQ